MWWKRSSLLLSRCFVDAVWVNSIIMLNRPAINMSEHLTPESAAGRFATPSRGENWSFQTWHILVIYDRLLFFANQSPIAIQLCHFERGWGEEGLLSTFRFLLLLLFGAFIGHCCYPAARVDVFVLIAKLPNVGRCALAENSRRRRRRRRMLENSTFKCNGKFHTPISQLCEIYFNRKVNRIQLM
jgi:hypothetical protein